MTRFKLLLARSLGKFLWEIEERMSQEEYNLWLSEFARRPWGEDVDDLRAGIIASTIANAHSTSRTFAPGDFLPRFGEPPEQSDEEIEAECKAYFSLVRARKALPK